MPSRDGQAARCFEVEGDLKEEFLAYLDEQGFMTWPLLKIPDLINEAKSIPAVAMDPGRDPAAAYLEQLAARFLERKGKPGDQGEPA